MKTSFILYSRNDGYKEKERFAIHLTTMLETFDEVIYVDWNSPTHSFLYDVLDMKLYHTISNTIIIVRSIQYKMGTKSL